MQSKPRSRTFISAAFILVLAFVALVLPPAMAQESTPEPGAAISFSGTITEVNATVIVVNGLSVSLDGAALSFTPQVGQTVTVNGTLLPNGQIIAVSVVIIVVNDDDDDGDGDNDDNGAATPEATPETTATPMPEMTPEVTPEATPDGDDDGSTGVIIVIEGPVQQINVNIITIYNINVVVNANSPILTVIQIGDIIRVEGVLDDDDDAEDDDGSSFEFVGSGISITIIAITVIIVDVDVVVNPDDGAVWRDAGDCSNAPPPWAPAEGWRRRCEGGGSGGGGGDDRDDDDGGGRGNDRDDDDGGDDDDD